MGRTFARRGGLLPLLVALLAIAPCAFALYPEQVEEYTWLRRRVSPATQIVPLEHDGGGVLVAGSEGTIARLRTADGEVAWRVVLSEGAAVHSLTVGPGIVIATVDEAPQLRVYNVTTGGLLWDADEALPSYPGTPTLAVSRISTGCWIARRTPASAIEFSTCYEGKVASTFTLAGISDAGVAATVHGDPKTPLGVLVTVVKRGCVSGRRGGRGGSREGCAGLAARDGEGRVGASPTRRAGRRRPASERRGGGVSRRRDRRGDGWPGNVSAGRPDGRRSGREEKETPA